MNTEKQLALAEAQMHDWAMEGYDFDPEDDVIFPAQETDNESLTNQHTELWIS
jgi:hypothetical protein